MNLEEYLEWIEQITKLSITSDKKEEKIIQVTDLKNFIEIYEIPIKIIDAVSYDFCIIETESSKKGILFYDTKYISKENRVVFPNNEIKLHEFKRRANLNELWFVFVEESTNSDFEKIADFIENKNIKTVYGKFLFYDFRNSTIDELEL